MRAVWILIITQHLFMRASGLGESPGGPASVAPPPLGRCLPSSGRAVFLALAEVNHSALTIFALPLYKRPGSGPADPITSLSGNKCLTIRPYWVWEINPFHSPTPTPFHLPHLGELSSCSGYCCSTSRRVWEKLLGVSKGHFLGFDVAVVVLLGCCSFSRFNFSYFCCRYMCVCVCL